MPPSGHLPVLSILQEVDRAKLQAAGVAAVFEPTSLYTQVLYCHCQLACHKQLHLWLTVIS